MVADFSTEDGGTLLSKCPPQGQWAPDAKALFLRDGHLVYDIGWVGALVSEDSFDDGEWHRVVLTGEDGFARLFVDGEEQGELDDFEAEDDGEFALKVGAANFDFAGNYTGELGRVAFFDRALDGDAALELSEGEEPGLEPAFSWEPGEEDGLPAGPPPAAGDPLPGPIRLQAEWLRLAVCKE